MKFNILSKAPKVQVLEQPEQPQLHVLEIDTVPGWSRDLAENFTAAFHRGSVQLETVLIDEITSSRVKELPTNRFGVVVLACEETQEIPPALRSWLASWATENSDSDRELLLICRLHCTKGSDPRTCPWRDLLNEIQESGKVEVVWGASEEEGCEAHSSLLTV